jgi:hypothetical protein
MEFANGRNLDLRLRLDRRSGEPEAPPKRRGGFELRKGRARSARPRGGRPFGPISQLSALNAQLSLQRGGLTARCGAGRCR